MISYYNDGNRGTEKGDIMPEQIKFSKIDSMEAVIAVGETLRRIDERLIDHGERVAFISYHMNKQGKFSLDDKTLFLLSIFHDIGAYKTDEIDQMLEFETNDVMNHSIYGYLFLKYMTPMSKYADAILHHHTSWQELSVSDVRHKDYAALIHLADRIDVSLSHNLTPEETTQLFLDSKERFCYDHLRAAKKSFQDGSLLSKLSSNTYHEDNIAICKEFLPPASEALEYLKMIVYSIDFRSDHTVTHTINTTSLALNIARHFGLPEKDLEDIYLGSLLHDVGKIAIPISILEHPGRLTDDQMTVMRTHVDETQSLIEGIVPQHICDLALRHHEKLDGSGYPLGLTAKDLTFPQRIVAVADIVSALSSRRSYKEPFPKEKTLAILNQMSQCQLDPDICDYICNHYDQIMNDTEAGRIQIIDKYQHMMNEYERLQVLL